MVKPLNKKMPIDRFLIKPKQKWLGRSARLFLYSADATLASKEIHASRKVRTWAQLVFLVGFIFQFLPFFAVIFNGLTYGFKSDITPRTKVEEDLPSKSFHEWKGVSQDPECLSLTDAFRRVELNAFVPSTKNFMSTLLCASLLTWIILTKLRCTPPKIPESIWEQWVSPKDGLLKVLFVTTLVFLSRIYLELTSLSEILDKYHGRSELAFKDISDFERSIGTLSSFIFGWLFYSKLETSERFLIKYSEIPMIPDKNQFDFIHSAFPKEEILLMIMKTAMISLLAHFGLLAVGFQVGPMNYAGLIKLTTWLFVMWMVCNIIFNISHERLSEELDLPVNYCISPNKSLHLSHGMRLTGESDEYLQHLCVHEFYQISKTPSRIKDLFSLMNDRMDLPTGFENVMDASFFIVDTFQQLLKDWMLPSSEKPDSSNQLLVRERKGDNETQYFWKLLNEIIPVETLLAATYKDVRISIIYTMHYLLQKDKRIQLMNIIQGQFQIMSWTMTGMTEAACYCKTIILNEEGILKLQQTIPCLVDLYEIFSLVSNILDETLERGEKEDSKPAFHTDYLTPLIVHCKDSLKKIHETFKDVYALLGYSEEGKQKVLQIIN